MPIRPLRSWAILIAVGLACGTLAHPSAAAPTTGAAAAETILVALESKKLDPSEAKVIAEAVGAAKKALERARGARASGDGAHARMLDALALEWAETARDLLRAIAAESAARESAANAQTDLVRVERARALLVETQARRGRAEAELARVESEAKAAAQGAAQAEEERVEKAAKKAARSGQSKQAPKKSGGGIKPAPPSKNDKPQNDRPKTADKKGTP